jgi:KDO2-lipid IV(A) lauroyltransferase
MLDWIACEFVRALSAVARLLPPSAAVRAGEGLGTVAGWLQPKRTRIGLANLRAAFPGRWSAAESRRLIQDGYRQLGAGFAELLRLPAMDRAYIERHVKIEGQRHVEQARASGRPVIFLTGHFGNWELCSITAALLGHPITALARAQDKFPRLYRLLVSYRESKGCRIVHKGGAMKRLIASLEGGELIGIVGDQASRQGVPVEFFGRQALFATGPFQLAVSKRAVLLPVFIHRTRGPHHRLVIEPPIPMPSGPAEGVIRAGIEQFAAHLERHIRKDPAQWLWMHKRWKHSASRRALILSDGKLGHVKQSQAAVRALEARRAGVASEVVEVRFRHPAARALALCWSLVAPSVGGERLLSWALTPDSAKALCGRWADLVVSCGSSMAPVNVLWSRANKARSVVLMNPAPLPLGRFDLVIAPRHDRLPSRRNVVQTPGAVAGGWSEPSWRQAGERLRQHPRFRADARSKDELASALRGPGSPGAASRTQHPPVIAVFIGGDAADYEVTEAFAETVVAEVDRVCESAGGWWLATTSRRTSPGVERLLEERLGLRPRCRMLLLASRDAINGTMEGMLGCADVAVVTGESISMVSEACASGRRVVVVEPPARSGAGPRRGSKHGRFLRDVAREEGVRVSDARHAGEAVRQALAAPAPSTRRGAMEEIGEALARLLK